MSEKNLRIRTNINTDKVVHVNIEQDVDFLEILSLKINQEQNYQLHVSNYGIIVGRILANDSFGIPNAKISVFIELSEEDAEKSEFLNRYPYTSVTDTDRNDIRYNLLPDTANDDCYRAVGTFPSKRYLIDNNTEIEIFNKYWKYTTTTNHAGDYMLFGVPTGEHTIHVDIDLSDIGILSQRPIDFTYKGYNLTQFENARQFKSSTNLNNLSQLISQNNTINVYPFWGDKELDEIAITRCDVQIQYKFETTCVFFGSMVTDNTKNQLNHHCSPNKWMGYNRNLVSSEGSIEMIRKTPDNLVEEFQIQGNRLINSDGVWCYQIPMNLDFVGTDEFGNIVPTDNPKKGIATRTSVRFRLTVQESESDGVGKHRARYLIPNIQQIVNGNASSENGNNDKFPHIDNAQSFDDCYEFGSATPDEYFRDLYWNKVYSVKNYIPRLQRSGKKSTQNYLGLRSVNVNNNLNTIPFNHGRFKLTFAYRVLCVVVTIIIDIISVFNNFISRFLCMKMFGLRPFKFLTKWVHCISISGGLTEDNEENVKYFPGCKKNCGDIMKCKNCIKLTSTTDLINTVQQTLAEEYDIVNLDFYNDWLNGCLYFPVWFWKKRKKRKFFFGLFSKKAVNTFCNCSKRYSGLRVTQSCSLVYDKQNYDKVLDNDKGDNYHSHYPSYEPTTYYGIIKEYTNKENLKLYYYAPGLPNTIDYSTRKGKSTYIRLFSTDIILLGSLSDCDLDSIPSVFNDLPSTTANVPFIKSIKHYEEEGGSNSYIETTGIDWLDDGSSQRPKYSSGLLFDLSCTDVDTKPKTCINLERLSELGVTLDVYQETTSPINSKPIYADGMITRTEIVDSEARAKFASLNNIGLCHKKINYNTGYNTYKFKYVYPIDFDGHLNKYAPSYTSMMDVITYDNKDDNYIDYRLGRSANNNVFFYSKESSLKGYTFPLYNNSFYFYFGLHEGKTAIDKFMKEFYANCYKNNKFPFKIKIITEPGKWCKKIDDKGKYTNLEDDFGIIDIELIGIRKPFSYKLYNEFNEEIMAEDSLYNDNIKFGFKTENGEYTTQKNGRLMYLDGTEVTNEQGEYVYLLNGEYNILITDVNGGVVKQRINLEQNEIDCNYSLLDLDEKIYNPVEERDTICNEDNQIYGKIIIHKINLDSREHNIINISTSKDDYNNNGGQYTLTIQEQGCIETKKIKLTINNADSVNYPYFNNCICQGCWQKITENGVVFKIFVPGQYEITLNQYCNEKLNDNISNFLVTIGNGKPFNAFINDMPMKFLLNKNFPNLDYKSQNNDANNKKQYYLNLEDNKTYSIPSLDMKNFNIWADFVQINKQEFADEKNKKNSIEYYDSDAIRDILLFTYKAIFSFCNTFYLINDYQDDAAQIDSKGGRGIILNKGFYPDYENEKVNNDGYSTIQYTVSDTLGAVESNNTYPNVITYNYVSANEENKYKYQVPYVKYASGATQVVRGLNSLIEFKDKNNDDKYNSEHQGSYFASFTNNGCLQFNSTTNNWEILQDCKYKSMPQKAKPNDISTYFRTLFVDKRLDYEFFVIMPYYKEINEIKDTIAGQVSGNTYNGTEMAYDNEYNVISHSSSNKEPKLEYNTIMKTDLSYNDIPSSLKGYNEIEFNNDVSQKRFYSAKLIADNVYDIRGCMQGKEQKQGKISFIERGGNDDNEITTNQFDYPMVRGFNACNIPSSSKPLQLEISSCSYNAKIDYDDDNNIIAKIDKGSEVEFSISNTNLFTNTVSTLIVDDYNKDDKYNVLFTTKTVLSPMNNITLEANMLRGDIKLNRDTLNTTHHQHVLRPFLYLYGDTKPDGYNSFGYWCDTANFIFEVRAKANNYKISYGSYDLGHGIVKNKDKYSFSDRLNRTHRVIALNGKFVFDDDDDGYSRDVIYYFKYKLNDVKANFIGFRYFRNYVNNNNDNLTKSIAVLKTPFIIDKRNITMSCTANADEKSISYTISGPNKTFFDETNKILYGGIKIGNIDKVFLIEEGSIKLNEDKTSLTFNINFNKEKEDKNGYEALDNNEGTDVILMLILSDSLVYKFVLKQKNK